MHPRSVVVFVPLEDVVCSVSCLAGSGVSQSPLGLVLRIWDDRRRMVLDERRIVLVSS